MPHDSGMQKSSLQFKHGVEHVYEVRYPDGAIADNLVSTQTVFTDDVIEVELESDKLDFISTESLVTYANIH